LAQSEKGMRCRNCHADYPRVGNALNFIDENSRKQFNLEETTNISDHPYDTRAQKIIGDLAEWGGVALDCGAGKKTVSIENVIQLEIVPYPHIDILAVNQALPFQDNTFDAVFSLDVLEHVSDPFLCAREIVRVLKPGGVLYLDMPFLCPEHGYPRHYFNATRMGVKRLFEDWMTFEEHYVPLSGHPIFALTWFLTHYLNHLDPGVKERFAQMTVKQIVARSPLDFLKDPIVTGLPQDSQWAIAATTQAILRKGILTRS
jgi:SAM-dependent methyltransferase